MANITGAFTNDYLVGTDGFDEIIDLLGGNDRIRGGAGDDLLYISRPAGLYGNDVKLWGETGADRMLVVGPGYEHLRAFLGGGDGDDRITAYDVGFARVEGGNGKDVISTYLVERARIVAGSDDDQIFIESGGLSVIDAGDGKDWLFVDGALGRTVADMGAGDDVVRVEASAADDRTTLTLGAGRDTVYLDADAERPIAYTTLIVIRDFETGYARDRFDAGDFLRAAGIATADPFGSGHLRLVQHGDDAVLRLDRDAHGAVYGWETIVRFQDADAASFVPNNLGVPISSMPPPSDAFAADLAALTL